MTELGNANNIITSPSDAKYIRFCFRIDEGYNTDWENTVYLVEGTQPLTEFIPYGEIYADGDVETISIHGKNLWNPNGVNYGWITTTGEFSNSGVSRMIEVEQGKTYTYKSYSSTNPFYNCIGLYDANKDFIAGTRNVITTGDTKTNTVTITNANAKYLACAYYTAGTQKEPDWQMIVEGTGDIPYEPYFNGGIANCENLLSVGDYKDEFILED